MFKGLLLTVLAFSTCGVFSGQDNDRSHLIYRTSGIYGRGGFVHAADLQPYGLTNAPSLRIPLLNPLLQTHFYVAPQPASRSLLSFKATDVGNPFRTAAPAGPWRATGLAPYALAFQPSARPLTITSDSWLGGPGNWNNGAQWSTGAMPGSNNNVSINNSTPAAVVQLNVTDTVNNLTVGSTSTLSFADSVTLTIGGNSISNAGAITLNPTSFVSNTGLIVGSSNVTLSGTGTLTMAANPNYGGVGSPYYNAYITGAAPTDTLTNQSTIQGAGNIGNGSMALVNSGTIDANQSAAGLTIQTSNGTTNTGTLEATAGGNLILYNDTYTNAGGTIRASGSGSVVTVDGATVNGGTVTATGGGDVQLSGATVNTTITNTSTGTIETLAGTGSTISGLSNPSGGQVVVDNGGSLTLAGNASNAGVIQLNPTSFANTTSLIIGASNVTLSGAGTLTMAANPNYGGIGSPYYNAYITGAAPTDTLTNQSTIQGAGNIGNGSMALVNSGTIDANQSAAGLTIQTSNGTTNTGTLEATAGGNLILYNDTYTNGGGTILASGSGSVVTLESVTINGGTLNTAGGGVIEPSGNVVLNGVANKGSYQVPDGGSTTLEGTISNSATIQLNPTSFANTTSLVIGASNVTLSGTGTLTMAVNPNYGSVGSPWNNAYVTGAAPTDTLTNQSTIQGAGNIGNGSMALVNSGTIDANQSAAPLTIQTSNGTTNTGTLEATAGGNLILQGDTYTNVGGTILASGSGSVVTLDNVTVNGGTLKTASGGEVQLSGATVSKTINTGTIETLAGTGSTISGLGNASGGQVVVDNGGSLTLAGNTSNAGAIQLNPTSFANTTSLVIGASNVTLSGTGTLTMAVNPNYGGVGSPWNNAYITGAAAADKLTNQSTIQGAGNIGNGSMALVNSGTIDANQSAAGLTIQTSNGTTNTGTLEATAGGNLILYNDTYTNAGGTILASGSGSVVTVDGATVNGGTVTSTGGGDVQLSGATLNTITNTSTGTIETLAGTGSQISGLSNPSGGQVVVDNGGSLTLAGNASNAGAIQLNPTSFANTTSLVIGASNVTLSGTGTLTMAVNPNYGGVGSPWNNAYITGAAAADKLTNQSTIQGAGNIGNGSMALVNSGTIDANQSAAALTIQTSNGTTNTGTLEATAGGNLILYNDTYTNAGGTILASGSGSVVTLESVTINGGTLNTASGGVIEPSGNVVLNGVANKGSYQVPDGGSTTLEGTISNSATIQLNPTSFANTTSLVIGASNVTLSGTGTLTMAVNPNYGGVGSPWNNAYITGALSTDTLTNKSTIQGAGNIGNGNMGFVNAGTVLANQGAPLVIDPSSTGFTNKGVLQVSAGSTLEISGGPFTNFSGTTLAGGSYYIAGTLQFGASGSSLTTNDANLILEGTGAQLLDLGGNNLLASLTTNGARGTLTVESGGSFTTTHTFVNSGAMDLEQGSSLNVTGDLTNGGTVTTNNANLQGGANNLAVTGKLTNKTGATVTIGSNNDTSDTAIVGSLANSGTITVGTGAFLTLTTATTDTNSGTIAVNGTLDIKSATKLSGAGAITLTNGAITGLAAGPKLTNSSTIQGSGTISNLGITNAGTLSANQAAPLIILPTSAGLNNTGTIQVSAGDTMEIGTSAGGALKNFSGTTLTGGIYNLTGTLQFGASGTTIATNAANITLNGTGQMIDFGNNNILAGFHNNGATGVFTLAGGASLTTTGGSFTNAGLFTVSAGTNFTVGGKSFNYTQTAGTTTVDGTLTSSTLGTLSVKGGALDGAGTLGYNVADSGTLTPGDSATKTGTLTVADTYAQNSRGALDIQINGATQGTNYDQLSVTKGATLGGTLNIALGSSFTPTVGETFTILTASSVSDTFATVNGLAIDSSEHFTITYNAGSVVLTVVSGALPASSPTLVTHAAYPIRYHGLVIGGGSTLRQVSTHSMARLPVASTVAPAAFVPVSHGPSVLGTRGFKPMDEADPSFSPTASAPEDAVPGSLGISPVSAIAYNSMSSMNHMRFECGVDLKALAKISRKRLVRALWASPDSPEALAIGYMSFTGAH